MLRHVEFKPHFAIPRGRYVRYEPYKPGMKYSLGFDTSFGIEGKDKDAGVLLDCNRVQIATLHGYWGEDFWEMLALVADAYGGRSNVFLVGERMTYGLMTMRKLWDKGYTWMLRDRDEGKPGRDTRDVLGHVPTENDITVIELMQAIATPIGEQGHITIRDETLYTECVDFCFRSKSKTLPEAEAIESKQLKWGAPNGKHDDLVRAAALANYGVDELPKFTPPPVEIKPDSLGAMLKHTAVFNPPKKSNFVWGNR